MTPEEQTILATQIGDLKAGIEKLHERIDRHAERNDRNFEEVKGKQDKTNGRVTGLEKRFAELKGIGLALFALTPFGIFLLQKLTS